MFGGSSFGSRPSSGIFSSNTNTNTSNSFLKSATSSFGSTTSTTVATANDIEVPQCPEDSVQALKFNPSAPGRNILLAAGSWDFTCRVWQVSESGQVEPKAMQNVGAPIMDCDWFDDGSKLFMACADKQARVWDLASNQVAVVGTHDAPIRTCHWIASPQYNCLMTGSWDKTLRFWDMRQLPTQSSLATINLPDRVFCSDMVYPMAVVALGNRRVKVYSLDGQPREVKDIESQLKYQNRSIAIFKNRNNNQPAGYALGCIEGRVGIQSIDNPNASASFTFKCHRSPELINGCQEIYPINDICFNPQHWTFVTAGGDGRYIFWDKDARTKLKASEQFNKSITKVSIHDSGNIYAYALGYDWSKGHEYNQQPTNSRIFLHALGEDMKPRVTQKKW